MRWELLFYVIIQFVIFFYYYYSPFYELSKLANSMLFLFFYYLNGFFLIYSSNAFHSVALLFAFYRTCNVLLLLFSSSSHVFISIFFLFIYFFVNFLPFYFTFIPSDHHQWTSDAHQSCYIFTCAYKNVVVGFGLKDKIPIRKYLSISHIQRAIICRLLSYQNTCVDPLHTHRTIWHIHSHFLHRCFSIFSIFPVRTDFGEMLRFHK